MYASNISAEQNTEQKAMDIDKLFRSEKFRKAFKKVLKYSHLLDDETTLSYPYCFEAAMANAVDSFKLAINEIGARDIDKNVEKAGERDTNAERAGENTKHFLKSKTFPQESSRRIKALVHVTATNLLDNFYKIFRKEAGRKGVDSKTEPSAEFTGTEKNC